MIKKIWRWIKTMILRLLHRSKQKASIEAEPAPGMLTELDKKLGEEILKRKARGKAVDTRQGGPNMPKSQPCPLCRRWSKRKQKTVGGANYKCSNHGEFFVRAK